MHIRSQHITLRQAKLHRSSRRMQCLLRHPVQTQAFRDRFKICSKNTRVCQGNWRTWIDTWPCTCLKWMRRRSKIWWNREEISSRSWTQRGSIKSILNQESSCLRLSTTRRYRRRQYSSRIMMNPRQGHLKYYQVLTVLMELGVLKR